MSESAGATGSYGPNDFGYINGIVRQAAALLVTATDIWCEGHYPHSNARVMPPEHPLAVALSELAKTDKETAEYANRPHEPALFKPHLPTAEAQRRWECST
jgi:hypothetical protein